MMRKRLTSARLILASFTCLCGVLASAHTTFAQDVFVSAERGANLLDLQIPEYLMADALDASKAIYRNFEQGTRLSELYEQAKSQDGKSAEAVTLHNEIQTLREEMDELVKLYKMRKEAVNGHRATLFKSKVKNIHSLAGLNAQYSDTQNLNPIIVLNPDYEYTDEVAYLLSNGAVGVEPKPPLRKPIIKKLGFHAILGQVPEARQNMESLRSDSDKAEKHLSELKNAAESYLTQMQKDQPYTTAEELAQKKLKYDAMVFDYQVIKKANMNMLDSRKRSLENKWRQRIVDDLNRNPELTNADVVYLYNVGPESEKYQNLAVPDITPALINFYAP